MFNFFKNKTKNKKINTENIRNYNEAIKTIKYFIAILEWKKAKNAINEIREKELQWFNNLIKDIENSWDNKKILQEKEKVVKKHNKKIKELGKLENELRKKEVIYNKKKEKERFEIRFKTIKEEIKHLSWIWKTSESLKLLSTFLEENPWNELVIKFFNKEKKNIIKQIEKEKEKQEIKLKQNSKLEALKLIWKTSNLDIENNIKDNDSKKSFFSRLKEKLNFYKKIKKKLENKKLLDEITLLIEEWDKVKNEIASVKLENIHKWLIKEIEHNYLLWYDLYWKILWAHKISWDTFWLNEIKKKYTFFIADATWHWIKAWFIITLLTRLFNKFVENKSFKELIFEINNWLKQDLKSMNFITWIFFEILKDNLNNLNFIWLWHEPILVYRAATKTIEKIIPWWLAAWIRLIKNPDDIKEKNIEMNDGDILITYSDWIVEAKSPDWKYYWIQRLEEQFKHIATTTSEIKDIYKFLVEDAKIFRWWAQFDDDLTILIVKRNIDKDEINETEKYLEEIGEASKLSKSEIRRIKWETKTEIKEELEELKREKQIKNIIKQLENLWLIWEVIKLKSEATRYIKEWFIHKKINYYLKKAIDNQQSYKISLKEDRLKNKYTVMKELLKKWDYSTVIKETEEIIAKDWNI